MEDRLYYAMGLGPDEKPIRTIASNPGLCLAAGIVARDRARVVADRLMSEHMYSGWGVRTLSAANPAYDPFSYHRGSVWPAEQAALAAAFWRYGLFTHLHRLAAGLFEAASLCNQYRLPEVFSGHARDAQHPFPSLYPRTNCPQAWSASCVFMVVQALTGIYPYAPLDLLFVDPHLPAWMPELDVRDLHVGHAVVDLRMWRTPKGESRYEVTRRDGKLHVVRQPSPWSVSAGIGERARDVVKSLPEAL